MKSLHATLSSFAVFALAGGATLQGQTNYDSEGSVQLSSYDWVDQEAEARVHRFRWHQHGWTGRRLGRRRDHLP